MVNQSLVIWYDSTLVDDFGWGCFIFFIIRGSDFESFKDHYYISMFKFYLNGTDISSIFILC